MIDLLVSDILAKVRTVPDLADTTLITVGGVVEDRKAITLPAARILYLGDHEYEDSSPNTPRSNEEAIIPAVQMMLSTVVVLIMFPYVDDTAVIASYESTLESVKRAIHGKESSSGHRWRDIGCTKALIYADRIGYEQRFTTNWLLGA